MWTEGKVRNYMVLGVFFTVTGVLGLLGALMLFFKGQLAVMQDNKPWLRRWLVIWGVLGLIPSPGLVIVGILLLIVWYMYTDDRFDFFGLLLEDVGPRAARPEYRPGPVPAGAGPADSRSAYATGYQEQNLYADDYSQAAYGGGEEAYSGGSGVLMADQYASGPVDVAEPEQPAEAPAPTPSQPPACSQCGKPTEWIEEYGRFYCYDCDVYV